MQTHEQVSVKEYLAASYRPDCDYVDGIVKERNMGEWDHGRIQARLVSFFFSRERRNGIRVVPEQRIQVKPTRFWVADVCVVTGAEPGEQVLTHPPFICIEILSREQSISDMRERVKDYLEFGVPHVWILDPKLFQAWQCTPGQTRQVTELTTKVPAITVPLEEIFD